MGRKHSKNAGIMGSEALTYHERKGLGHGMVQERLGKVRCMLEALPLGRSAAYCLQMTVQCRWIFTGRQAGRRTGSFGRFFSAPRACDAPHNVLTLFQLPVACCAALQDSVGNYYDCRLTLTTAVVSGPGGDVAASPHAAAFCVHSPCHAAVAAPLHASPHLTALAGPCASLPPPQDPVCTPKGFLFSREAILENLLEQKKGNKRKLAAFEAQQKDDARKLVRACCRMEGGGMGVPWLAGTCRQPVLPRSCLCARLQAHSRSSPTAFSSTGRQGCDRAGGGAACV